MTYDYYCTVCDETWEESHRMNDRDEPTKRACTKCGYHTITRPPAGLPIQYSGSKSLLRRAGSGWNDVLGKIKKAAGKESTIETR